jgi:hypothetical protein
VNLQQGTVEHFTITEGAGLGTVLLFKDSSTVRWVSAHGLHSGELQLTDEP